MSSKGEVITVFFVLFMAILEIGLSTGCVASNEKGVPMTLSTDPVVLPKNRLSMRVLWTVSGYVPGPGTTYKKEDADALIFSPLDMDESSITFAGKTCTNVDFLRQRAQLGEYLARVYATNPQFIGLIDQEVEVIKTNCTLPGFSEFLRLPDSRLLIVISGMFFYLEPVRN